MGSYVSTTATDGEEDGRASSRGGDEGTDIADFRGTDSFFIGYITHLYYIVVADITYFIGCKNRLRFAKMRDQGLRYV